MRGRILIIEDEIHIADIIRFNLEREGFETGGALTGPEGLEKGLSGDYDLILLDIMLPGMDGFEICRRLREKVSTPIIMVTAKEEEVDKILGLELGADDYVVKPFSNRELIARIKSNLRRADLSAPKEAPKPGNVIACGPFTLDAERYLVEKNGQDIPLTAREFELLKYLVERKEQVFSRESLLRDVWDYEYYGDARTVDVTMHRLREKIEDEPAAPKHLITKRGVGYYFKP